jgi:hypothetical protein
LFVIPLKNETFDLASFEIWNNLRPNEYFYLTERLWYANVSFSRKR